MRIFTRFLTASMITVFTSVGFADLQVFPLRAVLTEKERSAQVSVRHRGAKPMQYRISTVFYRMEKDGAMTKIADAKREDGFAGDLIRFSPKTVTLEPNIEQVVRVMLKLPAQLPDGEYRAHLHFEGLDESQDKDMQVNTSEEQMTLKARMAIAIPVIVRKGNPASTVSFSDLKIIKVPNDKTKFSVVMKKDGPSSVYGDIEIVNTNKAGKTKVITEVKGLSSYISERTISYPLTYEDPEPGTVKLIFKKPTSEGGEQIAAVETTVN